MLLKNTSLQKVSLKGRAISSHPSFVISSRAFFKDAFVLVGIQNLHVKSYGITINMRRLCHSEND